MKAEKTGQKGFIPVTFIKMIRDGKSNKELELERTNAAKFANTLINQNQQFQLAQHNLLEVQVRNYALYAQILNKTPMQRLEEKIVDSIPEYDINKPKNLREDYPFEFNDAGDQVYYSDGKLVAASLLKIIAMITDSSLNREGIFFSIVTFLVVSRMIETFLFTYRNVTDMANVLTLLRVRIEVPPFYTEKKAYDTIFKYSSFLLII